jgi:hypothetical protein
MFLGFNQDTGHPSAPWIQPSHRSTLVLLGFNQVTGLLQCSLDSTKSPVYPNVPWNQPSHRPPQCSLGLSKPPVYLSAPLDYPSHRSTLVLPWTIQATGSPPCSLGLIQATSSSQCSLGLIQATGPLQLELFYSIV